MDRMRNSDPRRQCRICGSDRMEFFKPNNIRTSMDASLFAITDKAYGVTGELWKCGKCGFVQAVDLDQPEHFYETLEDPVYVSQGDCRGLQARKLLALAVRDRKPGRLLDIGAGCGFLVEEAMKAGWDAWGVEPCAYLQKAAQQKKLPVLAGTFPHADAHGPFDVITMTDVIEHVPDPAGLLLSAAQSLASDGMIFLTTPDSGSFVARIMGKRWWHYRIAHIGYFNKTSLGLALTKAGLKPLRLGRPTWYFGLDYLMERPLGYLPFKISLGRLGNAASHITIPLNLRDSLYVTAVRQATGESQ